MKLQSILGILGGVLSLIAYFPYWYSIFKSGTRPQRASWLIWIFSDSLIFATSYSLGATDSLWVPGVYVICTIVTFIISLKRGQGGTDRFDIIWLSMTAFSVVIWYISGNPLFALIINLFIAVIGCIPTIMKIFKYPYSENLTGYFFWMAGSLCSLLSVCALTPGATADIRLWIQPLVFLILQGIIFLILQVERSKEKTEDYA